MAVPIIIEFLGSAGMENIDGYDCWPTTVMRPDVEETGLPRPFQCDQPYALLPTVECDTCKGKGEVEAECEACAVGDRPAIDCVCGGVPCPAACWGGWKPKGSGLTREVEKAIMRNPGREPLAVTEAVMRWLMGVD